MRPNAFARTIGLLFFVVGLTAISVGSAQANWKLITSKGELVGVTEALLPQFLLKEAENKTLAFLWTTKNGVAITHLCLTAAVIGMKMLPSGSTTEGKLRFTGCVTLLNGTLSPACYPRGHLGEKGVFETNKITATAVAGGIKYQPVEGENFAALELGEECAIGESLPVTGALFLKESAGTFEKEQVTHLFDQGSSSIAVLGMPLTLDATLVIELSGEHMGLKWAG